MRDKQVTSLKTGGKKKTQKMVVAISTQCFFIMLQNKISVADPKHMVDYIEWYITHMAYYIKYMYMHIYAHLFKLFKFYNIIK